MFHSDNKHTSLQSVGHKWSFDVSRAELHREIIFLLSPAEETE